MWKQRNVVPHPLSMHHRSIARKIYLATQPGTPGVGGCNRETTEGSRKPGEKANTYTIYEGRYYNIKAEARVQDHDQAKDWQPGMDLDKKLKFPDIVPTNLIPGMVLWSAGTKKIIVIELTCTVPWEERCSEANERNRARQRLADM